MYKLRRNLKYFSQHVSKDVQEVYVENIIAHLALALVFIFQPIYLYTLGYSLSQILLFFVLIYAFYLILITFGAKFAGKFGYKHSIFISNIFYVLFWIALYLIVQYPVLFFIAPIFHAFQKAFFWPAFIANLATKADKKQEGREMGVLYTLTELTFIVGPIIGGFMSQQYGFIWLFIIASILILGSVIPLFYTPEVYTKHNFKIKNLVKIFKTYPHNFIGYFGYADELMLQTLWPVFIFTIVDGVFEVGVASTIAAVIATMVMLYVGRVSDRSNKQTLVRYFTPIYSLSWIFRFLTNSLGLVVFFDSLTKINYDAIQVVVDSETVEIAGKSDQDFAINYAVFYEASVSIAKIIIALLGILILTITGSVHIVFILAGFLTMFYGFIKVK